MVGHNKNNIIQKQTFFLGDQFNKIRRTIEQDNKFSSLLRICSFCESDRTVTFLTEKIHPTCDTENRIPVLMLFSNPHPLSVQTGMYLSEPRSCIFWRRLFDCSYMSLSEELNNAIDNWSEKTPSILENHLLQGLYSENIILYFDCLEALPTNQYNDLKKIFSGSKANELRKKTFQHQGIQNLVTISQQNKIISWIVFSVEAYRLLVGKKTIAKEAPKRIKNAIDKFTVNEEKNIFWSSLDDLKTKIRINDYDVTLYLGLIARSKNWITPDGRRYFTVMLDQIFNDILYQTCPK